MLRAEEVMTTKVVTIHPEATIREAIELLINLRISGLPVVDKQNHLVGILTEFALLALAYDEDIANQTVEQHMTKEVLTVETDTVVNKIADMCIVHRVRRLPVLGRRQTCGHGITPGCIASAIRSRSSCSNCLNQVVAKRYLFLNRRRDYS